MAVPGVLAAATFAAGLLACGGVDAGATPDAPDVAIDAGTDAFVCVDGVDDALCGDGQICVGGACVPGECRTAADCAAPARCLADHTCSTTGSGADGPLAVQAGGATFDSPWARVTAIDHATVTTDAVPFAAGDEVLLVDLQGARGDVMSAGAYELATVASTKSNGVVLDHEPVRGYGVGGHNASLAGHRVVLVRVPNYTTVTLAGPLRPAGFGGSGTGLVVMRATGAVTIMAGASIDTAAHGFYGNGGTCNGVAGRPGDSYQPGPPGSSQNCVGWDNPDRDPNLGGGGGGLSNCNSYACTTQPLGAGGGGGGYATAGNNGSNAGSHQGGLGGQVHGEPALDHLFLGSGGGGGSGGMNGPGGDSAYTGNGGGIVLVWANAIAVGGAVSANGQHGVENNNCSLANGAGSGGGGSGGSVWLVAPSISVAAGGSITADGGPGGCRGGGAGGAGRIRLDCETCPTGGVSPAPYLGGL